jgi:hypothetical protein
MGSNKLIKSNIKAVKAYENKKRLYSHLKDFNKNNFYVFNIFIGI